VLDWSTGVYNPRVDVTRDTTTLYASDRDVFLFLVDDLNPIEAGRLSARDSAVRACPSPSAASWLPYLARTWSRALMISCMMGV
jgi:hypothetical protein